jgi:FkbM family methyltransferase
MEVAKKKGNVFVDVGANVGEYSCRLWRQYRTIVAIEPYHPALEQLQANFGWRSLFCRLIPLECAVSDTDGTTFLFLNRDKVRCNGSADTIEPVFNYRPASSPSVSKTLDYSSKENTIKSLVDTRKLDTVLFKLGIDYVDLLKIDVEGAEFRVLNGASGTVGRTKRIIVELHDREKRKELEDTLLKDFRELIWLDADHVLGEH